MKTIQLIQFTNYNDSEYGYVPDINRLYPVIDMEDSFYLEYEDDDGDMQETTYDSIRIRINDRGNRHVIKDDSLQYNLITLTLDDDSQLFHRR